MSDRRHFEDIWNEAEAVAEKMMDVEICNDELLRIQMNSHVDILCGDGTIQEKSKAMGDAVFALCAWCKMLEKKGVVINSARALQDSLERNQQLLLDPENADDSP
jgi:hypothetical protein